MLDKKYLIGAIILISVIIITSIIAVIIRVSPKNPSQKEQAPIAPSPASTPAINNQFLSIPSKNDIILDSLPRNITPGIIYFYKNTDYIKTKQIDSYLEGKIVSINKEQKNLSVNEATGSGKILITAKDYTAVKSIKLSTASKSKPIVKVINFDDLEIGTNVALSSLQYKANQSYIAGTIIKKE